MIDVNVGPALWLTQAVVPYLRERGSGSIVHVTARPGLDPAAGMAAYAVSKAVRSCPPTAPEPLHLLSYAWKGRSCHPTQPRTAARFSRAARR